MIKQTVVRDLNEALRRCMRADERVYLIGEDILDPYGGAFKVTAGLSTEFPERVLATPISEAAIVGIGVGAAMRGLIPVVEIMFGDFLLLAADQIINHASKFPGMYNGQVEVPLVIRTPMGGGRGYGPTHSQCLEKHFLGVPGLRVVAISHFHHAGELLERAILLDRMPVLFIEHKLLYPLELHANGTAQLTVEHVTMSRNELYPTAVVRNFKDPAVSPDVTIVTYGGNSRLLEEALLQLAQEEIWVETFLPAELSRVEFPLIVTSCARTRRVVLVEEGTGGFGWTAEVGRKIAETLCSRMTINMVSIEAPPSVIPAARDMEKEMLPGTEDIINGVMEVMCS
jgi:pyruvate/2-oxoglutarate/acetoin dehydrogenase E1 component